MQPMEAENNAIDVHSEDEGGGYAIEEGRAEFGVDLLVDEEETRNGRQV
jgi:hypothetical protein